MKPADPEGLLETIRELAAAILADPIAQTEATALAEAFEELDELCTNHGRLPAVWKSENDDGGDDDDDDEADLDFLDDE